jgi:hypothetical protein
MQYRKVILFWIGKDKNLEWIIWKLKKKKILGSFKTSSK